MEELIKNKICSKCNEEKPETKEYFLFRNDTKKFRNACLECTRSHHRIYYSENKEKCIENSKNWKKNNKEKSDEIYKRYRTTEKRRKRINERYHTDPEFNITIRLRRRIYMALWKRKNNKSDKTIKLLGCSYSEFKTYIESKFTPDMTWNDYLSGKIHIDHIRPCASFDLLDPDQQKICFHYTNLQPLWAKDNISKGDKWDEGVVL